MWMRMFSSVKVLLSSQFCYMLANIKRMLRNLSEASANRYGLFAQELLLMILNTILSFSTAWNFSRVWSCGLKWKVSLPNIWKISFKISSFPILVLLRHRLPFLKTKSTFTLTFTSETPKSRQEERLLLNYLESSAGTIQAFSPSSSISWTTSAIWKKPIFKLRSWSWVWLSMVAVRLSETWMGVLNCSSILKLSNIAMRISPKRLFLTSIVVYYLHPTVLWSRNSTLSTSLPLFASYFTSASICQEKSLLRSFSSLLQSEQVAALWEKLSTYQLMASSLWSMEIINTTET